MPAPRGVRASLRWAAGLAVVATATACAGAGGSGGGGGDGGGGGGGPVTLTLATVNNPQMVDMEQLKGEFEADNPDIKVKFVQMEENDLRDAVTKDVATQGGQYDMVTIGAYEVPLWQQNDWIRNLSPYVEESEDYDVDDLMPPVREAISVDGELYAVPFYGESSFLMYNKEIFAAAGLTMPENPTWTQVADLARKAKSAEHAGICLRGKPGWGEGAASLTTVVNTFGGAWYDEEWNAQVDQPEFAEATEFYADLLRDAGQPDPVSTGFTECLNLFSQGRAAIWYDATSAAGTLESPELSKVAGKVGYVAAPVQETEASGWLWSWNLAIPSTSKNADQAWEFLSWATSKDYAKLVGEELGWSRVPPGARLSTYEIPEYQEAAGTFADKTKDTMLAVDPAQPGVNKQNWVGIQYITIPEWQDLGTQASQKIAEVYAGRSTVDQAMAEVQKLAAAAGEKQKS